MTQEIIITRKNKQIKVVVISGNEILDFFIYDEDEKTIVDWIFKGRVKDIVKGLDAAFIDIGIEKNAFIYTSELKNISYRYKEIEDAGGNRGKKSVDSLKSGDDVIVQVERDPLGEKGARLTTHISLLGNKCVLMVGENTKALSRRIKDVRERARLYSIMNKIIIPSGFGVILRTAAIGAKEEEIKIEIDKLITLWSTIYDNFENKKAPCVLYSESFLTKIIKDWISRDVRGIYVNEKSLYTELRNTIVDWAPERIKSLRYVRRDILSARGLDKKIKKIFSRKVYLKSKAYFTVDETEGLIAIDINTGGFTGGKNKKDVDLEHTAFEVNKEMAVEIARHIRWRDLAGIIIIDFIDMHKVAHIREVEDIFKDEMSKDRAKFKILPLSEFCILQLTREKTKRRYQNKDIMICPKCNGNGIIDL